MGELNSRGKNDELAAYLRTSLKTAGLSYTRVARNIEMSISAVSRSLNGDSPISLEMFLRIADLIEIPYQPWLKDCYNITLREKNSFSKKAKRNELKLTFRFENVGKINKANISIRPFTVIAGSNSSGKSFITKSLYSIFSFDPLSKTQLTEKFIVNRIRESISSDERQKWVQRLIHFPEFEPKLTQDVIHENFASHILENFMAQNIGQLVRFNSKVASIIFGEVNQLLLLDDGSIDFSELLSKEIKELNPHPPIYIESPIYWKLTEALKNAKEVLSSKASSRGLKEDRVVSHAPKYFYDVLDLLELHVRDDAFSDIVGELERSINGQLSIENGNIHFKDKSTDRSVGLSLTALGITNLGMIALLLRQGAILPGTFLFIDEPEVHLHPSWQMIFVEVLYKLSKRGVNVVIASHSIDIMKAIENLMDQDDNQQSHFAINQLTSDGDSVDTSKNNYKRIASIKEDLGKPFYEMLMDSKGA